MRKWLATFSYFREKAPSCMFDNFLHAFSSIAMLLYYKFYYSFFMYLFCCFIIPLFYHSRFIALSELFGLLLFHFATYVGQCFLYFISLLSHSFIRRSLVKNQFLHIFYVMFYMHLLTLNDSVPFYCFNHYFNDISMVTDFK